MNQESKRNTRIIATLGPSTSDAEIITRLLLAGVNIVRLNMSHGTHEHHRHSFLLVKKIARKLKIQVAVFCDLCGPKIRVGLLNNGEMKLKSRSIVTLTTRRIVGKDNVIPCQYQALHKDVKQGDKILLDDGKMELKVLEINNRDIQCRVIYSGVLKDKKGINLPDTKVSSPALTANDKKDVVFAQEIGADFVALSFVRDAKDIIQLKKYMKRFGKVLPVISKIEKPEALNNFDEILKESYAIMVARGDLGIEIDAAQVPMVQKDLIMRSRIACRPVIVATHMMESMITSARPTRAEVGDVSNAALNGADAVMLSGETSVGRYPVQAVKQMHHILCEMEQWKFNNPESQWAVDMRVTCSPKRALTHAAVGIAKDLDLLGLFVPTATGATPGVVAAFRPSVPVVAICPDDDIARLLMLHWGVVPYVLSSQHSQNWQEMSRIIARKLKFKLAGRSVAILSGFGRTPESYNPVLKIQNF